MDVLTILEDIGLTRNEIKVYLALLSLGSTTSGPLIKQTGLHTSKVYDSLERLSEKGIVSHYLEDNSKHFKAVDPVRLKDFLAEKKKKITQQEAEIMKITKDEKRKADMKRAARTFARIDAAREIASELMRLGLHA